ncbi:hypothetical protein NTGHW29_190061 [Candidatus Nitrotoga sp. HW29]|nr:hypothetical protein NTGHW29_190061 [Candidatus Nitrotoga sp. HW29]
MNPPNPVCALDNLDGIFGYFLHNH